MHKQDFERARRAFLKAGGSAFVLSLIMGGGFATFVAHAGPLEALSEDQAKALLAMGRTLFPHDSLDDRYYQNAVNALDTKAAEDAQLRDQLLEGIGQLNAGGSFAGMDEEMRVAVLKKMEDSAFFQTVYGESLNGLYGNPEVWKIFGYEGSSVEHGGYLERGFDDITFIPKDS
ncbi:MAG: hypothetical protein IT532_12740 [Burkholderiales bacterium]|nr:hypothetical protein [Burkholderiales bacterium]